MREELQNLKCPDCGGKMLPRRSKFGTFWGCADYPKCKGTRDSEGMSRKDRLEEAIGSDEDY